MNLNDIRQEYLQQPLDIENYQDPTILLKKWFQDAIDDEINLVNAITLSTVDSAGYPNARVVLAKEISEKGLIIYTDYNSKKGKELELNPNVAVTVFWKEQDRQIRIKAKASKISQAESEKYFRSRPLESQISATASQQSAIVDMKDLQTKVESLTKNITESSIKCPLNWGGYFLEFNEIEFWQGRPSRLHDRFQFKLENGSWGQSLRLSP